MRTSLALPTVLLLAACGGKNEFVAPPAMPVGIEKPVVRAEQIYSEYTGRIEAVATVQVRARVKGLLEKTSDEFTPGSTVEKGTLLFEIEKAPYIAQRDAAKAALGKAEANLSLAETTLKARENAGAGVSKIQVEEARINVAAAKATVDATKADLATAELNLSYCEIKAPITGRISEVQVSESNLVGSGEATLLCTIVDDSSMYVYFEADERRALEFLRRRKGYEDTNRVPPTAKLTLADGEPYEQEAQLELADNRLDAETGTLMVRAIVPNPDGKLADGLFTRIKVPKPDDNGERVLVPSVAIQRDMKGFFVLVVGKDSAVARVSVTPGQRNGPLRIVDGLKGDEQVITKGFQRVREGAPVKPIPAAQYEAALKQAMSGKKPQGK